MDGNDVADISDPVPVPVPDALAAGCFGPTAKGRALLAALEGIVLEGVLGEPRHAGPQYGNLLGPAETFTACPAWHLG